MSNKSWFLLPLVFFLCQTSCSQPTTAIGDVVNGEPKTPSRVRSEARVEQSDEAGMKVMLLKAGQGDNDAMAYLEDFYMKHGSIEKMRYWQDRLIEAGSVYAMARKATFLNAYGSLGDCDEIIRLLQKAVQESKTAEQKEDTTFLLREMQGEIDPRISCVNLHKAR
jgi:hypothetical protein